MFRRLPLLPFFFLLSLSALAQMPSARLTKEPAAPPPAASKATTIYLVRHAEKAGVTGDVELSEAGVKRSQCLATTLADANLHAIYTTEYKRTKNTAAPTAAKTGVAATVIGGAEMDKQLAELRKDPGRNVLVVGHSNTVPVLIEKLGAGAVTIKDEEYDHLYIVTLRDGQASLASLRYCH